MFSKLLVTKATSPLPPYERYVTVERSFNKVINYVLDTKKNTLCFAEF